MKPDTRKILRPFDVDEFAHILSLQPRDSRIYIGSDSERFKRNGKWLAQYSVCVAIHRGVGRGKDFVGNGATVRGEVSVDFDYDQKKNSPAMRLTKEVTLLAEMANKISHLTHNRHLELHIDLNKDKKFGSSVVVDWALAYLKGMFPEANSIHAKPLALVGSFAADILTELLDQVELSKTEAHRI